MHNGNHSDEGMGDATGWSAFMAGALIGAGVALLLAPQPGTELRSKLRDYADRAKDDLVEKGKEVVNTAVERGREYYDKGETIVREAGRSASEFAALAPDVAREPTRAAKEFAKQAQDMTRKSGRSVS